MKLKVVYPTTRNLKNNTISSIVKTNLLENYGKVLTPELINDLVKQLCEDIENVLIDYS